MVKAYIHVNRKMRTLTIKAYKEPNRPDDLVEWI
jgi:hypothetical protein